MYKLKKRVFIDAAHSLPSYEGKCKNTHGHRWEIEVEIGARETTVEGMVFDFSVIKDIIKEYDHENLNDFIDNPTAENIAHAIFSAISRRLSIQIHEALLVRVTESPGSVIEYTRPLFVGEK